MAEKAGWPVRRLIAKGEILMELEAQLLKLLDKEAIREATLRYSRGIDRHDDEIMAQAYHPDAVDDHGAYIGEAVGLIKSAGELHSREFTVHHHYLLNQTIELDGDTAHGETYYITALRRKSGPIVLGGGRYIDRFERRDGQWAVAERACVFEWVGELPPSSTIDTSMFLKGTQDRSDISYERPFKVTRSYRDSPF
jgi:hypothetical protein